MRTLDIYVHHYGGLQNNSFASTQDLSLSTIDQAHRSRWPHFKSELGYWVGYNIVIDKYGRWTQTRRLGAETAAVRGHNLSSVSICLAGNFSAPNGRMIDEVTPEQIITLQDILFNLTTGNLSQYKTVGELKFSPYRVYPHRVASNSSCYGTGLSNNWVREIQVQKIQRVIAYLQDLIAKYRQSRTLSGDDRDCAGFIS